MTSQVSVIILAYREPDFLNALLVCVAKQTLSPVEILIVDDASGDEFTSKYILPPHARVLVNPQRQALAAISRNAALREARGEYVAFVDQDDLWQPEKLAVQAAALESQPAALLHYTHLQNMDAALHPLPRQNDFVPLGPDPLARLLKSNFIAYSSVMLRRSVLEKVGWFDESIRAAADWDMWLRIAAAGPILADPRPLLLRRHHDRQWSKSRLVMAQGAEKVMAKAAAWIPAQRPDLRRLVRRRHARSLRRLASAHLAGHSTAMSMTYLRRSVKIWPLDIRTYGLMCRALLARGTICEEGVDR
jgi:glycosyltransferase involved in cell wall biosynthesis